MAKPRVVNAADGFQKFQGLSSVFSGGLRLYQVDLSKLTNNLKDTLTTFQNVMDELPSSPSGYCIDEIELNLGVNGKGGIALIGKLDIGVEAAIKVKMKRESTA